MTTTWTLQTRLAYEAGSTLPTFPTAYYAATLGGTAVNAVGVRILGSEGPIDSPATDTTLQQIRDKLITAPASDAGLAAILAKMIASPATDATAQSIVTQLQNILGKLISAPATDASLQSILTKLNGTLAVTGANTATAIKSARIAIVTTGTAVPGPNVPLVNGCSVKASVNNAQPTSAFSAAVGPSTSTTAVDGTGTGLFMSPGDTSPSFPLTNMNQLWFNGTANDVFAIVGC